MADKKNTYVVHKQDINDKEETVELTGTRVEIDSGSHRHTVYDGDEIVGSFVRVISLYKKG